MVIFENEFLSNQIHVALTAVKAFWLGMPMEVLIIQAFLVGTDLLTTRVTVPSKVFHVAVDTVWMIVLHHVAMAAKTKITFETSKVIEMPGLLFSKCVFTSENQLITSSASWIL
ncbi:unnamed protein product [Haemonchus placei]|uniref:7TM_GPCR_Srx domain-containing protein n=1 Tax=Haemonchus placei TaxID=6290 RepID=A0A0N4WNA7_HAEPC|nr:unnamed protein product [Haemonchus placei]